MIITLSVFVDCCAFLCGFVMVLVAGVEPSLSTTTTTKGSSSDGGDEDDAEKRIKLSELSRSYSLLPPLDLGDGPQAEAIRTAASQTAGGMSRRDLLALIHSHTTQQHLLDADPHWKPHVMFYYDRSQPASAWGAAGMTAPIIDATGGSDSPVITLLIPVSQWSDGRPAVKR